MKKRLVQLAILAVATLSTSACQDFADMFYFGGDVNEGYSFRSVSTPPPGDDEAHEASYTYSDYAKSNVSVISVTPSVGSARLLIIPIWFSDSSNYITETYKEAVRADIETSYFGTNEETGWRSVKSYYEEESHGHLTISGTVSEWHNVSQPSSYYYRDTGGATGKTALLVRDSVIWYFNNHGEDSRQNYDCDGDGYIDGVMLIYAAPDYSALNLSDEDSNLWAYCFWIQDSGLKNTTSPGPNAFFWASYDFMYSITKARARTGNTRTIYGSGDTSFCNVDTHTYIHEMGHMFGLEDYYDYSKYKYCPAAGFSMQDNNVGGHDPFSSFALGWGKAYVPNKSTTINLQPFATTGEMIVLSPEWNSYNSPFDEYLILEYYTNDGLNEFDNKHQYMASSGKAYPAGSASPGIRLWHVDSRLAYLQGGHYEMTTLPDTTRNGYHRVTLAMSNTYDDGRVNESYLSPLARENPSYTNFNLLQLIRLNGSTYKPDKKDYLSSFMLFTDLSGHDEFKMNTSNISKQFFNTGKLNSGKDLGFSFKVNALQPDFASIEIVKL